MMHLGRLLIITGLVITVFGLIFYFAKRIPFIERLPGDILIKRENFTFYFPLATSILISVLITLIFYIIGLLKR